MSFGIVRIIGINLRSAIAAFIICLSVAIGFVYGVFSFRTANFPGAIVATAMLHDQHAMAVAMEAYPEDRFPTEKEIMRQLFNIMSAYRTSRYFHPWGVARSESFHSLCSILDDLQREELPKQGRGSQFLLPPFISYIRSTPDSAAVFLDICRLHQKLSSAFDSVDSESHEKRFPESSAMHTSLLLGLFEDISNRCPELRYTIAGSSIGDVACLDVSGFMELDKMGFDSKNQEKLPLELSKIPPVPVNIDKSNASPRTILNDLQNKHLISFSLYDTNFIVRILARHDDEQF